MTKFTLRQLQAEFVRFTDNGFKVVPTLLEAQGVWFKCPLCFHRNRGAPGTHMVLCWFMNRGVPDDMDPKPGRWKPSGSGLDDLTFVGPNPTSVLLQGGCGWHGYIQDGHGTVPD